MSDSETDNIHQTRRSRRCRKSASVLHNGKDNSLKAGDHDSSDDEKLSPRGRGGRQSLVEIKPRSHRRSADPAVALKSSKQVKVNA